MQTFRAVRHLEAPAAAAWERISNVLDWPRWLPTVDAVSALDTPALDVGARYEVRQPKLRPACWRVTELEPGHRFIWESGSTGLRMWASHAVRAQPDGRCEIDLAFRFSGLLAPLVVPFAGKLTQRYVHAEADALKAVLEAGPAASGR